MVHLLPWLRVVHIHCSCSWDNCAAVQWNRPNTAEEARKEEVVSFFVAFLLMRKCPVLLKLPLLQLNSVAAIVYKLAVAENIYSKYYFLLWYLPAHILEEPQLFYTACLISQTDQGLDFFVSHSQLQTDFSVFVLLFVLVQLNATEQSSYSEHWSPSTYFLPSHSFSVSVSASPGLHRTLHTWSLCPEPDESSK